MGVIWEVRRLSSTVQTSASALAVIRSMISGKLMS